jgi:predicted flap endonuclease-1-like 5' DNA nuclease
MDTQIAGLKDDLQEIYGVGPVVEGKLNASGIYKYRDLAGLDPDEFRKILGPDSERAVNEEKIIALAGLAARATENVRGEDLTAIRGVGPVIAGLLNQAGVYTYADLGRLTPEQLEVILGDYVERLADEDDIIKQARKMAGLDS